MNIDLFFYMGEFCFEISTGEKDYYDNSGDIAKLFNLNVDLYNKLLVDKVIKHNNYYIDKHRIDRRENVDDIKDLSFDLNNVSKETYIERFKEAFAPQLILFTL